MPVCLVRVSGAGERGEGASDAEAANTANTEGPTIIRVTIGRFRGRAMDERKRRPNRPVP